MNHEELRMECLRLAMDASRSRGGASAYELIYEADKMFDYVRRGRVNDAAPVTPQDKIVKL